MNRHGRDETMIEFAVDEVADADGYSGVSKLEEAEERRSARVYIETHGNNLGRRTYSLLAQDRSDWADYEKWKFPRGRSRHEAERAAARLERHRSKMYVGSKGGSWSGCDPRSHEAMRFKRTCDDDFTPDVYHHMQDPSAGPMPVAITVGGPREWDASLRLSIWGLTTFS